MIINVILLGIMIILGSLLYFKSLDIKNMKDELSYINEKNLNNSKVTSNSEDEGIRDLVQEINMILSSKQENEVEYQRQEERIREMIASISHDLRTPLTSIKGYTDLLLDGAEGKDEEYLNIIKSRVDSLNELIINFYELSKLELRGYDYDLEYVNLSEVLADIIAANYNRFKDKALEPRINIGDEDFNIIGDRNAIERIFTNLIDNGIKYSSSEMGIDLIEEDDRIITRFTNDISDFNRNNIDKIFDKFYVVDTARQSESTGLGLFITRELINNMGYEIKAELVDGEIIIEILW